MMAQELRELCELLHPDSPAEHADQYKDIVEYIKKLGSQSWEYICKEPNRLNDEMNQLTEQTQDLAFTNYKTFVQTADISKTILNDLDKAKESLGTVLSSTPEFIQECESFSQEVASIVKEKNKYSSVSNQNEKIMEILEFPSLMREALNAEDYESALDIFTVISNLSKRYQDMKIVQNTTSEIMSLWFETLYNLFNRLRYDLPLPQCLQILGYLRRANTIYNSTDSQFKGNENYVTQDSSDGLHLHFLKARNAWFENVLEDAKNTEAPEKLLRRIVELHRIHLFNVLTQHKSIFLSDAPDTKVKDDDIGGASALSTWLKLKVHALKEDVNNNLQREDESSLESLFNQCMYLCLSFGRVGADMRCVLTPLFRKHSLSQIHSGLERIDKQFENYMFCYKVPNMKKVNRPVSEDTLAGPLENLLDYYPLAEYCNGLLTVLNLLRVIAPLDLVKQVYNSFEKSLRKAVNVLIVFYNRENKTFSDIERQNFVALCICFTEDFVPYISKCLSVTFPLVQVAELLGVTLSVLQESKILHLDQINICEPLNLVTGL